MGVKYAVKMPKSLEKTIRAMPKNAQKTLQKLVDDIQESGPVQPKYKNFSSLGKDLYHCHLAYKWVAVWRSKDEVYYVEVTYVGSREKAPY